MLQVLEIIQIIFPPPPPSPTAVILHDMGPQPPRSVSADPPCLTPDLSRPGGPWQMHVGGHLPWLSSISKLLSPAHRAVDWSSTHHPAGSAVQLPRMNKRSGNASPVFQEEKFGASGLDLHPGGVWYTRAPWGCTRRSAVDVCCCVQWFVGRCCKGIYLLNAP